MIERSLVVTDSGIMSRTRDAKEIIKHILSQEVLFYFVFIKNKRCFEQLFFDLLAPIYDKIIGSNEPVEIIKALGLLDSYLSNGVNEQFEVMEIGGGTGRFAKYFLKYYKTIWLLDPSIPMLKEAKKSNNKFRLKYAFADDIPFQSETFDLILIYDSLHHWNNQAASLSEIYRVLKKGGQLMIAEIHPRRRAGHYIVSMEKFFMMGSNFFTPKELKSLLSKTGFEKIKFQWARKPTYFVITTK